MTDPQAIAEIAAAFDRQDYRRAARLVNPLLALSPDDPWLRLYAARLHELSGRSDVAEPIYRQLLQGQDSPNPKILAQARQGLQRLATLERQRRSAEADRARSSPEGDRPGVLILTPVTGDRRLAAQALAKIFDLDAYSARLQLPARSWRLYRSGPIGELRFYAEQLQAAGVACFWADLTTIGQRQLLQVLAIEAVAPEAIVLCKAATGQLGQLRFHWSEVSARVSGEVPTFESVVDLNARGQVIRVNQIQDWLKLEDLHLGDRNCVLRFCEASYHFDRGVRVQPTSITGQAAGAPTRRTNWNAIVAFFDRQLADRPQAKDFKGFADTVMDWEALLTDFGDRIPIDRPVPTIWDAAFHFYSLIASAALPAQSQP